MRQDRPHWMKFYFKDFFGDPKVKALNHEQIGLYVELMAFAWDNDPVGTIPADVRTLRAILRRDDERFEGLLPGILSCFRPYRPVDGLLIQKRLRLEYEAWERRHRERVKSGKKGAKIRHGSLSESYSSMAQLLAEPLYARSDSVYVLNSNTELEANTTVGKKGGAGGKKGKAREVPFSLSPLAKWEEFRAALSDWQEEQARYYFTLFQEIEAMHPTKYKYARWDLAARTWARRRPNEWKEASSKKGMSFDEIAEARAKRLKATP